MSGVQSAIIAFFLWGIVPLYWHELRAHNPWELVAHRSLWSLPLLIAVLALQKRGGAWLVALKQGRIWLTSVLLAANWLLFVYLTVAGRLVEASLGYFIVPLCNALLGVGLLRETLRPLQRLSLLVATLALLFPLADIRFFPWASLGIAVSWSLYGYLRKGLALDATVALTAETAALVVPALGFLLVRHALPLPGGAALGQSTLVVLAGPVTVTPLLFFGYAVARVPLTTLGLLQYLGPTITFLIGVFYYHEPLPWHRVALLATVWVAILLYVVDGLREHKRSLEKTSGDP